MITEFDTRTVNSLRFLNRRIQITHTVHGSRSLISGHIDFPVISGAFQQTDSFPTPIDALLIPTSRIKYHAIKTQ